MNNSQRLFELGQSLWYDNIQRGLLKNGRMHVLVAEKIIYGVTSNPSIFNAAIGKTTDYDSSLQEKAEKGQEAAQIFEELAVEDIQEACELFGEVYAKTGGGDGFVSLEVNPDLAHDTEQTCAEAQRLWEKVNRPNLMVKIPATAEGVPAIRRSIAKGININITLIFSRQRYQDVIAAYLGGLQDRLNLGEAVDGVASVASFFVSRIDSAADALLQPLAQSGNRLAGELVGKTAIANAKLAYQDFKAAFASREFIELRARGARVQRPLWASTSTKNPLFPDTLYVDNLIGPETVNTVPPETLEAFIEHGAAECTLEKRLDEAEASLKGLESLGISLDEITDGLEKDGVHKFSLAYNELIATVETRRKQALK
ncbi:MAG: transaldolase [Chloroflexi bacterium]|nr:transaldolase [Chloroflexota bacterium]